MLSGARDDGPGTGGEENLEADSLALAAVLALVLMPCLLMLRERAGKVEGAV